ATSGSSQAVNLGTPSLLPTGNAPRTIAGWAKTNTTAGDRMIVSFGTASTGQAMFIGQTGSSLIGGGWGSAYNMTVASFWTVDTWHHVAMTYDGTTARLYADGVEVSNNTKTYNLVLSVAHIGKHVNSSGWWSGTIDDVRIYDRALSAAEVAALMNASPQPPAAPSALSATPAGASQINL